MGKPAEPFSSPASASGGQFRFEVGVGQCPPVLVGTRHVSRVRDAMLEAAARTDVAVDTQLAFIEFPSYELIHRPIRLHTILNKEHIQR